MGTLPHTALLVTCHNLVIGQYSNYYELALALGAKISDEGKASVQGITDTVTYNIGTEPSQFDKHTALKDFARTRMLSVIQQRGYQVYRYVT